MEEEIEEIEMEGESYKKTSPLRELRAGLKKRGLGRGKNKEGLVKLVHRYTHFAENLSTELRSKADEGEDARGQVAPRVPSKAERQAHELTHWPYQDWWEHRVATRGKEGPQIKEQNLVRQEGKADMPAILMDFCFTKG